MNCLIENEYISELSFHNTVFRVGAKIHYYLDVKGLQGYLKKQEKNTRKKKTQKKNGTKE